MKLSEDARMFLFAARWAIAVIALVFMLANVVVVSESYLIARFS